MTDLKPPELTNDCFALPPGVNWVPVDEALALLRRAMAPVAAMETRAISAAGGRILAQDAVAQRPHPPRSNSAVDGFGFAAQATGDGPQILPLVDDRAAAGAPAQGGVAPGHAIRILTGAPLPEGVDTVVLEEDTRSADGKVAFNGPVKPGANTRLAGEDLKTGDVALPAGRRLQPQDLALLAAAGLGEVAVRAPLRVGVLSTGDELTDAGADVDDGAVVDANRPMLLDLLARWGFDAIDLGIARDDRDAVRDALASGATRCDAILTSGGASAGDEDHVSALMRNEGQVETWRIAIKPGRPLLLGMWSGTPVFGLPGNPVAAFVCTLIFGRPALHALAGADWQMPQAWTVPAAFSKNKKPGRREYLRARLNADGAAEVFRSEGSGRISGLSWADGLVEIDDEARMIEPGSPVRYIPFASFGI